jgi:hypothetical protein
MVLVDQDRDRLIERHREMLSDAYKSHWLYIDQFQGSLPFFE